MRNFDVFQFDDYKQAVSEWLEADPSRGLKARLAEAGGFQPTYLSQVLKGSKHFSPEQAEAVGRFIGLPRTELEYFLLLVQWNRAGTPTLRALLGEQVKTARRQHQQISERVPLTQRRALEGAEQALYYNSWLPAALHMAVTLREAWSEKRMAAALNVGEDLVARGLQTLRELGLVDFDGQRWVPTKMQMHVSPDSPFLPQHHKNWREFAGQLRTPDPTDLRYTSVITLSAEDVTRLRADLLEMVAAHRQRVIASPEERMYCYQMDFLKLI